MSSSQLTFTPSFFRGVETQNHQPDIYIYIYYIFSSISMNLPIDFSRFPIDPIDLPLKIDSLGGPPAGGDVTAGAQGFH
jgi:hypothetical protein